MKRYFLLIALTGATVITLAQSSEPLSGNPDYDRFTKTLEKELDNHKGDLKNQFSQQRIDFRAEVEEDLEEIHDQSSMIRLFFNLIWVFGGLTAMGLGGAFWGMYKSVKSDLRSRVTDIVSREYPRQVEIELKRLVTSGSQNLVELIRERSFENEVKREMPFCVVCLDPTEKEKARMLLEDILEFKCTRFVLWEDFDGKAQEELIIYYDMNGKMVEQHEQGMIDQLADALQGDHSTIYILSYQGHWKPLNDYKLIANAANSPYTLYGRMMESLTYLYLKKRKQSGLHA